MEWDRVSIPLKAWKGIPLGFHVKWEVHDCPFTAGTKDLPLNVSSYEIKDLRGDLTYKIQVMGRTAAGAGEPNITRRRTHTSSKKVLLFEF